MTYDWTKAVNRTATGAAKWEQMKGWNPEVSEDVYPYSVADIDMAPPEALKAGLIDFVNTGVFGYTMPTEGYYSAVIGWMKNHHQWDIRKEWIILSPGVVTALYNCIKVYTHPGDGIIIQQPVYYPFIKSILNTGRTIANNRLIENGTKYVIDFEDLEEKVKDPKNKMMILCSPHNPVGRVWTKEELTKIGDLCADNDVILISDEIHFDLVNSNNKHIVISTLSDKIAQNTVVLTAPSKSFNIAGCQTSNVIIQNDRLRESYVAHNNQNGFFGLNAFGLKACEIVYTQCSDWLSEFNALIEKNHNVLKQYMAQNFPQIKVFDLEGTYLQWMDFCALNMSIEELETFLHKDCELFFDEGYVFGDEGKLYERMNIACPTEVMLEGLERLKKTYQKKEGGNNG